MTTKRVATFQVDQFADTGSPAAGQASYASTAAGARTRATRGRCSRPGWPRTSPSLPGDRRGGAAPQAAGRRARVAGDSDIETRRSAPDLTVGGAFHVRVRANLKV